MGFMGLGVRGFKAGLSPGWPQSLTSASRLGFAKFLTLNPCGCRPGFKVGVCQVLEGS